MPISISFTLCFEVVVEFNGCRRPFFPATRDDPPRRRRAGKAGRVERS
jgi:hypothetical protein